MSKMYIRVKKDGFIYDYNDILARNPACEVITEEQAYPERFMPEAAKKKATRKSKKVAPVIDMSTDDIPEPPEYTLPELAEEASRGLE